MDCAAGLLFDVGYQYCNWANLVTCAAPPVASPPTPQPVASTQAPTTSPSELPTEATGATLNCPAGHSGYLPYDECTKYFYCQNGQVIGDIMDCAAGLLFDVGYQYCNWANLVTCAAPPVASPPTPQPVASTQAPTNPPKESPTEPPLSIECPSGFTGLRPSDDCTQYYHCYKGVVMGGLSTCPGGTLFDLERQYCNWENDVTCVSKEGCYSNNFRDCNHAHFQSADASCHTIWLPHGNRNACIALWGPCTAQNDDCCEPAICYHDADVGSYGQCALPPDDSRSLRGNR